MCDVDFQGVEEIRGDERADHSVGFLSAGQVDALRHESRELTEELTLFSPVLKIGNRDPVTRLLGGFCEGDDELLRLGERTSSFEEMMSSNACDIWLGWDTWFGRRPIVLLLLSV